MIITREDLNMHRYAEKFRQCDKLLSTHKPDLVMYKQLLQDKTTFAYLNFRINGDRLKLFPYQDLIINDHHRFIIFRAANQIGKSLLLDVKAAINLLLDHGYAHNEAIVSKSLPQSIFQMRRVKSLLNSMQTVNWKEEKGSADSMSVITVDIKDQKTGKVKYSNMTVCAPCTEGLLGYDLHEVNLDEFEFWDVDLKHFFNQIAQPRTYSTKGNITIFSNPNGQDNFVADLEKQLTLKGGLKWHTYIFNYNDKPGNTQDEYDQLKHELSRHEFESTVAAIRTVSNKNYFSPDEIDRSHDKNISVERMVNQQPYFFLDVGAKHDQSVLCGGYVELGEGYDEERDNKFNRPHVHVHIPIIHVYPVGYPLSRVVGVKDVPESDGWHYEKSVSEYLDEWRTDGIEPVFGVDVTGNSGISPLFETVGITPIDVTFSGPVKSGMYQRFKYMMEKGLIHRVKNKDWEYQAAHLVAKKTVRGYLQIHHENENDLDDCMDATAGLIHLADNPDYIPYSLRII